MKNLITIFILFVAFGCGKSEVGTKTERIFDGDQPPLDLPLVGSYEKKFDNGDTFKLVLLENRKAEIFLGGNKAGIEAAWKLFEKEVHTLEYGEKTFVHNIEPNGDLTLIARIIDENRTELPKELQFTLKKLKE